MTKLKGSETEVIDGLAVTPQQAQIEPQSPAKPDAEAHLGTAPFVIYYCKETYGTDLFKIVSFI